MRAAKLAIAIAVALIAAAAARAEDRFEKTFSRTLTYRGGRVTVENRFGALNVRAGCHTFRATGITAYLLNGGTIENAQAIAAHDKAVRSAWVQLGESR